MSNQESLETERKYEATLEMPVPDFRSIEGVESVAAPVEHELEAVYFDTDDLALARHRVTLRRRTGGEDSGWHVKLPAGTDSRLEIHAPLGQPETVPEELSERLLVFTRLAALRPVARVHTRRTVYRLRGADHATLADFADDFVTATALHPAQLERQWREWEVELLHGDQALFDGVEGLLSESGAKPSAYASKLAHTFGTAWPPAVPTPPKVRKKGPAGDTVMSYVAERIAEITALDSAVRQGTDDSVHQMRSATRRLRSILSVYGKLFDADVVAPLKTELKWLSGILGRARDAEVLRARIADVLNAQPDELLPGPAAAKVTEELDSSYNFGYRELLRTMGNSRYFRLLDALETFRDDPPLKSKAKKKARPVTAKLSANAIKRLRRSQKTANKSSGAKHDPALHRVRKDAKRLRHAAEVLETVHGKPAAKLARRAQELQKVLGEHQDSVIAQLVLRRLARETGGSMADGSTFGRLLAAEEQRAADSGARYEKLAKKSRLKPL